MSSGAEIFNCNNDFIYPIRPMGSQGLQHVSSWVTRDEFDIQKDILLNSGLALVQEGTIPYSGV